MATKAEIISQLEGLGIAFDATALKADLEALLPADVQATDVASDTEQADREAAEQATAVAAQTAQAEADAQAQALAVEQATADANALALATAIPVEDGIAISDIITPVAGDNAEQARLRGVFTKYFEQNPDRASWEGTKEDMINQLARAGEVTE